MSRISEREWALLEALWATEAATARQVAEAVRDQYDWAYTTVKTMLDRLEAKGLVTVTKVGPVRQYTAALSRRQARIGAWKGFVTKVFGGDVAPALQFLASDVDLTAADREALRTLIEGLTDD